jgi:hypothetical protein
MTHIEWFEIVDPNEFSQGDIFFSVQILKHPLTPAEIKPGRGSFRIEELDGVILTQTCDLRQEEVDLVLFCPIYPLNDIVPNLANSNTPKAFESVKKQLWEGKFLAFHMLNICNLEGFKNDYLIVDLKNPRSLPIEFIKKLAELSPKRIRLKSPYKEYLSQSFARVVMRIGIPDEKPSFH